MVGFFLILFLVPETAFKNSSTENNDNNSNILSVSNIGKIISKGPNSSYTQVVFSRLNSQETEMETLNGTEIDDSLFIGQKDQTGFIGS